MLNLWYNSTEKDERGNKNMKKLIALLLAVVMVLSLAACSDTSGGSAQNTDSQGGEDPQEVTTIEFWYHDGNDTSNAYWNQIIEAFEAKYPQYRVNYTGLPAESYNTKYTTAIATGTAPDVLDVRDTDMATMIGLGCMTELSDYIKEFDEYDSYVASGLEAARSHAFDGGLYCLPMYATVNICWANTTLMNEKGISMPTTQTELLEKCESVADPANNAYFFSLRGGDGSTENLFDWLFTYANQSEIFEEDGTCVLSDPIFAEAMDKYASIYWNGWTSGDSITNGFKEMVAEFGSGTSMFIMHNSSSLSQHKSNLGEGNFANVKPLANDQGTSVTKGLSYVGLAIMNTTEKMEASLAFVEFVNSAQSIETICAAEGRIPLNALVYESEWFKSDPYNAVYSDMMEDENIAWMTYPMWLVEWSNFQSAYVVPGLQAVLLKERTSEDVLAEWADYLTAAQQNYLASLG